MHHIPPINLLNLVHLFVASTGRIDSSGFLITAWWYWQLIDAMHSWRVALYQTLYTTSHVNSQTWYIYQIVNWYILTIQKLYAFPRLQIPWPSHVWSVITKHPNCKFWGWFPQFRLATGCTDIWYCNTKSTASAITIFSPPVPGLS